MAGYRSDKAVMGLSGGMDSSTLLGFLLNMGWEVHCCVFNYGSKHNLYENEAALNVAQYYKTKGWKVHVHQFDLQRVMIEFNSALLKTGEEIPEGHFNDESMKKTIVPGRNLIFTSIMAGLAESLEAEVVALGVHAGDHHIYPDCRADFIDSASKTVLLSSDRRVHVVAPFQEFNKVSILRIGYLSTPLVPYHFTRTCYKDQPVSCGKCGSCQERLEAFKLINMTDPIEYEGY